MLRLVVNSKPMVHGVGLEYIFGNYNVLHLKEIFLKEAYF